MDWLVPAVLERVATDAASARAALAAAWVAHREGRPAPVQGALAGIADKVVVSALEHYGITPSAANPVDPAQPGPAAPGEDPPPVR